MNVRIRKGLIFLGGAFLLVLAFQNCSDFVLQDQVLYEQSVLDSQSYIDSEAFPKLLNIPSLKKWFKKEDPTFVNEMTLFGDQWSVVVVVDRLATGKIITVHSGAGQEEGFLELGTDGTIRAARYSTSPAYLQYLEGVRPSSGENMVIAVAFGEKASEISLAINGVLQRSALGSTGTPIDFSFLSKQVVVTDPGQKILEYMIYVGDSLDIEGQLSRTELNAISRYLANSRSVSNVVFDVSLIGDSEDSLPGTPGAPGTPDTPPVTSKFTLAKAVFDAKCISCHKSGGNSPNLVNLTEAKAVNNGWVTANSPGTSSLYYKLKGAGGNMPVGDSISAAQVQTVADWINSIQ